MVCSNPWSVVASVVTVIGLISIAAGLKWSQTGQLICNTFTIIIEGFCMMVLIQAHGWTDYKRRFTVKELAISRELSFQYYQQKVLESKKAKVIKKDFNFDSICQGNLTTLLSIFRSTF